MMFSVIREAYKKQLPLDQRVRFKRYLAHNFGELNRSSSEAYLGRT